MLNSKLGRLLIVDDEIETLTPLCDLLSEWGYEVAGYTSPKDALKELKGKDFDLLLTDLVMPEMDGIELIKAAMSTDPLLVSIIITGKGTIQTSVEAMKNGAFDYILKPIDWKMLQSGLSRAMEVRRLRKAEERYRSIVEDQTELICRFLPDGTLTFVNKAYCRYFGKKSNELVGCSFMLLIPKDDRAKVKEQILSLSIESPVETHENSVIKANGEICWQQWTNRAIFNEHGNIVEYQSVGWDITERKQIEQALQESEARYRNLYNEAPDMYHTLDENGVILECNETEARMLGYGKEEIIGKHITNFFTEESKRLFETDFPKLKTKKELFNLERKFIRKDGTTFPASMNVFAVYDEDGTFTGAKTIARDITLLKQIEDTLKRSEKEIRTITNTVPALISYIDTHGYYKFVNARYEEWFGMSKSEIIGKHVREVLGDAAYHRIEKYIEQASAGHSVKFENDIPFLHGGNRWTNIAYIPDIEEGGKVNGFYALVTDITDRKQMEDLLKESEYKYKTLADNALVGIYKTTLNGDILYVNEALLKMLEYNSPEEFISINAMTTYKYPNDRKLLIENLKKTGRVKDFETELFTKNRRAKNFILNATLEGDVISGMMLDINERKQAEETRRKYFERLKILSYRLLEVQEAERRYIAKELHDEIGQTLTSLKLSIDMLSRLPTENITDSLGDLQVAVGKLLSQVRNLSLDLRPSMLDDLGLLPALLWHFERYTSQTNIRVLFKHSGLDKRFIPEVETVAYRIVQEALTNVARHAVINEATVMVTTKQDKLVIQVKDKGAGFDFNAVISSGKAAGLHGMEERLTLLGGKLTIKSSTGTGTRLTAEIPIEDSF
jgi:PAS domain S-box-containing protein